MKKALIIALAAAMSVSLLACSKKAEELPVTGGWTDAESSQITDELAGYLEKVAEAQNDGASYEPVKLLSTQVVAGMNYRILCNVTEKGASEAVEKVVTIYVDLQKNCRITSVTDPE